MNTDDYLQQCTELRTNKAVYRLAVEYQKNSISKQISNTLIAFKSQLSNYNKKLYSYLQPQPIHTQIAKFYGIPKIHKTYDTLPPMRPIANNSSLLTPTARFLDHILQPVARVYPDYLHNSASLSLLLETLEIPRTAILVSVDVESLYPSIPQTECLSIISTCSSLTLTLSSNCYRLI